LFFCFRAAQETLPVATTDDELNALLDQIESEIGMDLDLTQDLLDILNEEQQPKQLEEDEEEELDEDQEMEGEVN
jgi:hypothetical protein